MKKSVLILGVLSVGFIQAQQVGRIGINTDDPKATLDVKSASKDQAKGILIPQLSGNQLKEMTANLTTNQQGLVTFVTSGAAPSDNTTLNVQFPGYYRFNISGSNKTWIRLEPSGLEKIKGEGSNAGWALIGRNQTKYGKIGNNAVDMSTGGDALELNGVQVERGATGNFSFATGVGTLATGWNSTAMGEGTMASGNNSVALGWNTEAVGIRSFAMGSKAKAYGFSSVAMGYNVSTHNDRSIAMGTYNTEAELDGPVRRLLVLGNGNGDIIPNDRSVRSDAFTVLYNGKVGVDIDNFEKTTANAKLQVNGAVKVNSNAENITCNSDNVGTMTYKEIDGSGVFGFCVKRKGEQGGANEYVWAYIKGGSNIFGTSDSETPFGNGL